MANEDLRNKLSVLPIYITYILYVLSITVPKLSIIADNYIMYAILITSSLSNILLTKTIKTKRVLAIAPFLIAFIISTILLVSGYGSYINLINLILIILASKKIKLSKNNYKIISVLTFILLIVLWIKSIFAWKYYVLNIDYDNPNAVAQGLVLVFSIICTIINTSTNIKHKYFYLLIISIITFISIINCNSRTAIIAYIILIIFMLFKRVRLFINKRYKAILITIIAIGTAFPFIYINFYNNSIIIESSIFSQKSLYTGRQDLWTSAINEIKDSGEKGLILGLGSHHETNKGEISNFHNWYLGLIYYFGLPLTVGYFIYLVYEFPKYKNLFIKIALLSIFIFGFSETSALWARTQMIIFILLLYDNYTMRENRNEK